MKCDACGKDEASPWYEDRGLTFCSPECHRGYFSKRWFQNNAPIGYRDTVLEKLPCQPATKELLAYDHWAVDARCGFYLFGVTGSGKTRSTYEYLKIGFLGQYNAEDTVWIRGTQFQREVINRTRPGGDGGFDRWIENLNQCELLIIDETDKIKFTERVDTEFFDLIEHRIAHKLDLILIANCGVDRLGSKMCEESGAAVARKIKEKLHPIRFTL